MPQRRTYDVVVVGGRVAGSLTAALLAARGVEVLVVDRSRFPSPTLSTHYFRGDHLVRVIEAAGLLDDVLALGSPRLTCEYAYEDGASNFELGEAQDPGDFGACLSVRRETLDATLLEGARRLGVDVLTGTPVRQVLVEDGRACDVVLADGTAVTAHLVVGADGLRSTVATGVAAADRERHEGRRGCYYRYVHGFGRPPGGPGDGPEFSQLGDEMAYVFPSDQGLACVALSVNLTEYDRMRHDADVRFDELLRRHRGLWPRFAASTPVGRLLGQSPQPDYVRAAAGPGWALVGDSGIHQDPWSGAGMDTAGVSAELLVQEWCDAGGGGDWSATYEARRDAALLDTFHQTVDGAADLAAFLAG